MGYFLKRNNVYTCRSAVGFIESIEAFAFGKLMPGDGRGAWEWQAGSRRLWC